MKKPSTRNLAALPDVERLRQISKSVALLDEVLQPEWEYRRFSFEPKWGTDQVAQERTLEGNGCYIWFPAKGGAVIRGFDAESKMVREDGQPWPGLVDGLPKELRYAVEAPEWAHEPITLLIWQTAKEKRWRSGNIEFPRGKDPDGSEYLLDVFDGNPKSYVDFAKWYHKKKIDPALVNSLYENSPIPLESLLALNPKAKKASVIRSAKAMGFALEAAAPRAKKSRAKA